MVVFIRRKLYFAKDFFQQIFYFEPAFDTLLKRFVSDSSAFDLTP